MARIWLEKAVEQGNKLAFYFLASKILCGLDANEGDWDKGIIILKELSRMGFQEAIVELQNFKDNWEGCEELEWIEGNNINFNVLI